MLRVFPVLCFIYLISSCSPDKETVVNEIIIRDTVYINAQDTIGELGGIKLQLLYRDEFGFASGIIDGTEIVVQGVENANVSEVNEKGEVFIDGLISGRTYGIDVIHKGSPLALIPAERIGSNIYLEFEEFITITDISQSEIQSVSSNMIIDNDQIQGIDFSGVVNGPQTDSSSTKRGMVIFVSKFPDVSPTEHLFAYGIVGLNNGSNVYNPQVLIPDVLIRSVYDVQLGDTLFYTVHGGTASTSVASSFITGYWGNNFEDWYLGFYPNVNAIGIKGSIVYDK